MVDRHPSSSSRKIHESEHDSEQESELGAKISAIQQTPNDDEFGRKELTNLDYANSNGKYKPQGPLNTQTSDETAMKSDLEVNRRLKRHYSLHHQDEGHVQVMSDDNLDGILEHENDHADAQYLTLYRQDISSYPELINHYFDLIEYSNLAGLSLNRILDQGWEFQFDDIGNSGYYIENASRIIWLDHAGFEAEAIAASDYFYAATMLNVLRATRDAWQEGRWQNAIKTYHPEALLCLEKLRAADSDIAAVLFACELQDQGHGEFMRHLLASDDAGLARYFTGKGFDKKVQAASAFRAWFLQKSRVDATDHETLCYLDTILDVAECDNPFGRNRLTPLEIVRMGCMPDGMSYLSGYGEAVIRDPVFVGLSDPINQAHYYHLVRDMNSYTVNGVPFRSSRLAAKIFPEETVLQE